jgi:anti-sigma-K factor RskA
MTGRVLPFHGSAHATADALLPWYVNGTLHGEELAFVEQHVGACEACRHEVEWLREVFAACATISPDQDAPATAAHDVSAFGRRAPRRDLPARLAQGWQAAHPWMRGLLAAQLAAIAILATILVTDNRDDAHFQSLGATYPAASSRNAIAVMFDPATTELEMQRIVIHAGARIVDGPTVTNAFVLEVPAAQSERAMVALRGEPMVRFAEPLGARAGR